MLGVCKMYLHQILYTVTYTTDRQQGMVLIGDFVVDYVKGGGEAPRYGEGNSMRRRQHRILVSVMIIMFPLCCSIVFIILSIVVRLNRCFYSKYMSYVMFTFKSNNLIYIQFLLFQIKFISIYFYAFSLFNVLFMCFLKFIQ